MLTQPIQSLTNRELLALLVGENQAECLLMETEGSLTGLSAGDACALALCREPGLQEGNWHGPRLTLAAAREFARRCLAENLSSKPITFGTTTDLQSYLKLTMADLPHEVFMALWLDSSLRLIDAEVLFRGTLTQAAVYPREVAKRALLMNASSVVVAHNHPSRVCDASNEDIKLTQTLNKALNTVGISLLDHVIVAGVRCFSFRERRMLK